MFNYQRILIYACLSLGVLFSASAKNNKKDKKKKKEYISIADVKTTDVRNQQSTGTCWAFATTSFIETEILRETGSMVDISEMYIVRHAYSQKAKRYFRLHGKGNFSEGGQAHDVMNVVRDFGFVPEDEYKGNNYGSKYHIHKEMVKSAKAVLDEVVKNPNKKITPVWEASVNGIFDVYMGEAVREFQLEGKTITPQQYAKNLSINADDYVEITSYTHRPFYKMMNLDIPDNWSSDLYYNVPLEELMLIIDNALKTNYSVCWDGDVSEKGFTYRSGCAVLPNVENVDMVNSEISKWSKGSKKKTKEVVKTEMKVDQALRQSTYDDWTTTDDHLMHLTGIVKDKEGKIYYKTKNSWAASSNSYGGYLYMSESYVQLKTVAIMVHKNAIPAAIAAKLGL